MHNPTLLALALSLLPTSATPLAARDPPALSTSKAFRLYVNSTNPSHALHSSIHGGTVFSTWVRATKARAVVDADFPPIAWFQHPDTGCTDLSTPGHRAKGSMLLTTVWANTITGLQRGFEGIGSTFDVTMNDGQLGTRGLSIPKGSAVVSPGGANGFYVCKETHPTQFSGEVEGLMLNLLEPTPNGLGGSRWPDVLRPTENCTPVSLVAGCHTFGGTDSQAAHNMWEEPDVKEYVEKAEEVACFENVKALL